MEECIAQTGTEPFEFTVLTMDILEFQHNGKQPNPVFMTELIMMNDANCTILGKYILILVFIFATSATPQIDTTLKEFYPLQVGNTWQYLRDNNSILTSKIKTDTLLNGELYYVFETIALRSQGKSIRIDSLMRVQNRRTGPTAGDSCGGNNPYELSYYHLAEPDSTVWEICDGFNGHLGSPLARFNNKFLLYVFGEAREVMQFDFGGALIGEDTVWGFGTLLAKGIGIIEERYYEGDYGVLQGAIINGVKYGTIVSIDERSEILPKAIVLYQNYPNPFNPVTTIGYSLSESSDVSLIVYNILGEKVMVFNEEYKNAGNYEVVFDASNLPGGIYVYTLIANSFSSSKKMILLK
jgi:hypothetical protein